MGVSAELIEKTKVAAKDAGIPFELLAGLVQTESAWNPGAISKAGAVGLTQVMPWWLTTEKFSRYGLTVEDLKNPDTSLWIGAEILADELKRFGTWELAAMAYNGGAPKVQRAIQAAGTREPEAVSQQLDRAETQAYWKKVLKWSQHFAGMIGEAEAKVTEVVEDSGAFIKGNAGIILGFLVVVMLAAAGGKRG